MDISKGRSEPRLYLPLSSLSDSRTLQHQNWSICIPLLSLDLYSGHFLT